MKKGVPTLISFMSLPPIFDSKGVAIVKPICLMAISLAPNLQINLQMDGCYFEKFNHISPDSAEPLPDEPQVVYDSVLRLPSDSRFGRKKNVISLIPF